MRGPAHVAPGLFTAGLLIVGLLIAGCQRQPAPQPTATVTATPAATPSSAPTPTPGLSRYLGKYPFDPVDGITFLADPRVVAAVRASGAETRIQELILGGAGPQTPIRKVAGKIVSWGCEAHNCGPHNWTLAVLDDGSGGEVCYFNEDEGADPVWYADGRKSPRTDPCPSGE